jgi:hypothetical protein
MLDQFKKNVTIAQTVQPTLSGEQPQIR